MDRVEPPPGVPSAVGPQWVEGAVAKSKRSTSAAEPEGPVSPGRDGGIWMPPPAPPMLPLPPVLPLEWAVAYGEDDFGLWQAFEVSGVRQVMRWIPPGEFLMGSPETEAERRDNETLHRVRLTRGFWLADTACTQELWEAVMGGNPSGFQGEPELPVERVSWNDIRTEFLVKLNALVPGLEVGLPTEAQWEYACRAGRQTPFWFGDQITTDQVNYDGNYPYEGGAKGEYRERTVPVKGLPANGWGLYQMHGNVWEWCADWSGAYSFEEQVDPEGPQTGRERVLRGGSWDFLGRDCRSAVRSANVPDGRNRLIGFRLARGPS